MKLYVASSWKNDYELDEIHYMLREAGHITYDFRDHGRSDDFQEIAKFDWKLLDKADGVVLVLPSNQSSHIEAGVAIGSQRPVFITWVSEHKYEPMYLWANAYVPKEELVEAIERYLPSLIHDEYAYGKPCHGMCSEENCQCKVGAI